MAGVGGAVINLTKGSIAKITGGGVSAAELQPTLQVTELKQVQTKQQQPQQSDRFRLVLWDGSHLQQAMLGAQINHLVKEGNLRSGSIVQLIQYTCTTVQTRMIIIILELVVVAEECDLIGHPVSLQKSSGPLQSPTDKPRNISASPQSFSGGSSATRVVENPNMATASPQGPRVNHLNNSSLSGNYDSGRYGTTNVPPSHMKAESGSMFPGSTPFSGSNSNQYSTYQNPRPEVSRPPVGAYSRPNQSAYQQPSPMYTNRGPVSKNEAPPRIIPIAALNPYQDRWTIKARVTAKAELRHYNNPCGDGKLFSFDLLDSDGGEISVTCFNAVADQFYHQIEAGKVYLISKGNLKPARKNFNHLRNDLELFLESSSTIQLCSEDDNSIPRQQFHFRPISDVEDMDNNSVVDVIGVVTSITPTTSLMRKNGPETQKRTIQLKDMSGRSVELTLWGNFCTAEGQHLQSMCDSGGFPVLAVKTGRVSGFNEKAVGTISSTQLLIEPDFPEARKLKDWFDKEGRSTPVSISREMTSTGKTDGAKTISQIKDERLGTSEKPDWITVNATVIFMKADHFCYTACPIMAGDRPCSRKVTNNGDGKWRCEKCDQSVDECDYRYILQLQIQDDTGITWVTAFQECGAEIMGISAKDLHSLKHEKQDDEGFSKIIRQVLFSRYVFKLKVKEETFSDEQRVKSTVVKVEKVNYSSHPRFLLYSIEKLRSGNPSSSASRAECSYPNSGLTNTGAVDIGIRQPGPSGSSFVGSMSSAGRESVSAVNQVGQYGNQYSSRFPTCGVSGAQQFCSGCGATGHNSTNCPSILNAPAQSMGGSYGSRPSYGAATGGASDECYKCHHSAHWPRDCTGVSAVPPAYGARNVSFGRTGGISKPQFTIVKVEKVNYSSHCRFLLDSIEKLISGNPSSSASRAECSYPNSGLTNTGAVDIGIRQPGPSGSSFVGSMSSAGRESVSAVNQVGQYGNQYSSRFPTSGVSGAQQFCNGCGATGHNSTNCPSILNAPAQSMGGSYGSRPSYGADTGGASDECYKCHQSGHWPRDCPGVSAVPPAYGARKRKVSFGGVYIMG